MTNDSTMQRVTTKDEAKLIIMSALPELPEFILQRWAGGVEMLAALRAEEKPEKPAS